jgi:hypothetical protein
VPLVPCRECKNKVSSLAKTCPVCGVPDPGLSGTARLIVHRGDAWVSRLAKMRIYINGNEACSLQANETKVLSLDAGIHDIFASLALSGRSETYRMKITNDQERKLEVTPTWDLASGGKPKIKEI